MSSYSILFLCLSYPNDRDTADNTYLVYTISGEHILTKHFVLNVKLFFLMPCLLPERTFSVVITIK